MSGIFIKFTKWYNNASVVLNKIAAYLVPPSSRKRYEIQETDKINDTDKGNV